MTIDDRLRGAHRRQLQDVQERVAPDGVGHRFVPTGPSTSARVLAAAAVILVLGAGVLGVRTLLDSSGSTTLETDVGGGGDQIEDVAPTVEVDLGSTTSTVPSTVPSAVPSTGTSTTATSITAPSTAATSLTPTAPSTETTATTSSTSPTDTADSTASAPAFVSDSAVCPTGRRAALERARLRYVGENEGWGRLFDLVDEQDEQNYYMAWEPGYPDQVTVEVVLAAPVNATEIRVAQDPFTPVSGAISLLAAGEDIRLELSGVGGWQVHLFGQPVVLDRFTITRAAAETNVVEILVCVTEDS